MDIVKVSLLAIAIVFAITFTKQIKPEMSVIITVAGSVVMLIYILGYFNDIVVFYNQLVVSTGVNQKYFTILLKAIGIGYLVEFASGVCRDSGNTSIADKVVFVGKLSILSLAIPVIQSIFEIISDIL
ncbi:MAG: hypothetical protein E7361_02500 [Clostridiales bacterium]|nr:hypothetical protein [Clostridiales bacterium]